MEYFGKNLEFLRDQRGISQAGMKEEIDIERTTWNNYEKGKSFPNLETFARIVKYFGVSADDLLYKELNNVHLNEKSEEKKQDKNVNLNVNPSVHLNPKKYQENDKLTVAQDNGEKEVIRMPQVITVDASGEENVVMVPIRARAGYLNGYGDREFVSHLPTYRLPGLNNGTFRMFEVGGLSMHPTLEDKDILITQFVENLRQIRDDRVYVVVTKHDGVVVKRVLNRIQTENKLILKSDNIKHREEYPTLVIDPGDVLEIWYAIAYMSRYLRSPTEMYTRMIDLEGRLTLMEHELKKKAQIIEP